MNEFVTFTINEKVYGVDISNVQTITPIDKSTRIPGSESHIDGVTNLRGDIITVISLFELLQLENKEDEQRILVYNYEDELIGLLIGKSNQVQKVDEVSMSKSDSVRDSKFIKGLVKPSELIISEDEDNEEGTIKSKNDHNELIRIIDIEKILGI